MGLSTALTMRDVKGTNNPFEDEETPYCLNYAGCKA